MYLTMFLQFFAMYHIITKELATEFEGQFEFLGENTENCNFFSIPMEKGIRKVDKDDNESVATIRYKMKFLDSSRFMVSSLSNHKITCNDSNCFLEYESVDDNLIKYKCLSCNKNYLKKINEKLKK